MHQSLQPYEERVAQGYLRRDTFGYLVLYNYTNQCTYAKAWDEYTLASRGLIFHKCTGDVVARPFPKFFNLGEHQDTMLLNLPDEPYEVFEKVDGSLGILYWHCGVARIATRGSFTSEQALEGLRILNEKYYSGIYNIAKGMTLLFEIIYPENRVNAGARLVVNYGDIRELVLLAAYNATNGQEFSRSEVEELAKSIGCPIVKQFNHTIEEMVELQKTLPATQEGFVVRFQNGLRVKIKGAEYVRMNKMLNGITPLFVWENMVGGIFPNHMKADIPEEVRVEIETMIKRLEGRYRQVFNEIVEDFNRIPMPSAFQQESERKRHMGIWIRDNRGLLKHPDAMFAHLNNRVEKYIKDCIKPKANVIQEVQ